MKGNERMKRNANEKEDEMCTRKENAGENPKGNKEIWESRERCRLLSLRNKHNK